MTGKTLKGTTGQQRDALLMEMLSSTSSGSAKKIKKGKRLWKILTPDENRRYIADHQRQEGGIVTTTTIKFGNSGVVTRDKQERIISTERHRRELTTVTSLAEKSKRLASSTSSGSNGQNPEGASEMSKAMRTMLKFHAREEALADAVKKECDAEEQHYAEEQPNDSIPDRPGPYSHPFDERQFGEPIKPDATRDFPCSVVSLALFDGDKMLFACSGIPLPRGRAALVLTRYVTTARLAREYVRQRYRDDKLKIEVRLPNGKQIGGFLELHNRHIAIVTLLGEQSVYRVDVELQEGLPSPDGEMLAAGRAFESGCLMGAKVEFVSFSHDLSSGFPMSLQVDLPASQEHISIWKPVKGNEGDPVAVLGGPVLGESNRIIGMNVGIGRANAYVSFVPLGLLCRYLKHFQILNPNELHFRGYSFPYGVETVVPSGLMRRIYRIKHYGYPMPPPLMLQLNGELRNTFEECFGESLAWKGYPFNVRRASYQGVWMQLRKDVVADISRRVVSIASYHGYERYFVCTGLLIKWHQRTVVLTSASLVRRCDNEDDIDDSLKIEVFLPPKQRAIGTLEFYDLNYNIAIVSVEKKFISISPEDIFIKDSIPKLSEKVVAVGREPRQGLLMASIGEVKRRNKDCKLDCKDLKLSTCKIKKAGIGGPLIKFDGSFVGMNFFDGRSLAPFLPRSKIVQVLTPAISSSLPSESGDHGPVRLEDAGGERGNRWPVPELYWYHGQLDVDRKEHTHIGRIPQ